MKAVILLNGERPARQDLPPYDVLIAADGAQDYARDYGWEIDYLLGDFDSSSRPPQAKTVVRFQVEKDETDGQLCLDYALSLGAEEVVFLGAGGGREDHFLGNLQVLYRALKAGVRAEMITAACRIWAVDTLFEAELPPGTTLSVVPICGPAHILEAEGLKYPASGKDFTFDSTLGISNITQTECVRIRCQGTLLIFAVRASAPQGGCT